MEVDLSSDHMLLPDSAGDIVPNTPQFVYLKPEVNTPKTSMSAALLANQNLILANQTKIIQCLAKIVTTIEHISQVQSAGVVQQGQCAVSTTGLEDVIDPINSVEDLDLFEENLKDDRVMNKYIQSMSFVCGTSGKANGWDSAYKLVDFFLTRQFLLQCSWTGNARAPGVNQNSDFSKTCEAIKVPLKFYKRFRALFLKLIILADRDFSEMDCDEFLKRVIKNGKQRVNATTSQSRHRNRPKHLKYKARKSAADTDMNTTNNDTINTSTATN